MNDGFVTRLLEDTAGEIGARGKVRLASLRGISVGSSLTFRETIAGVDQSQNQTVTEYDSSSNSVTLDAPLDLRYTAAGCQVTLAGVPEPVAGNPSLKIEANSKGT